MNSNSGATDNLPSCEFQENLDILRQIDLFSRLPLEAVKLFAYLGTREKFETGEFLFQQEEDDGQAFHILSGRTALRHRDPQGQERVIRHYEAGAHFGGLALLGGIRRLFSMQAETDTVALVLSRPKFTKALEQFPDVMPVIIQSLIEGIYNWERRFLNEANADCDACRGVMGISLF